MSLGFKEGQDDSHFYETSCSFLADRASFHMLIHYQPVLKAKEMNLWHVTLPPPSFFLKPGFSIPGVGCLVEFIMMEFCPCHRSVSRSASRLAITIQISATHSEAHTSQHASFTMAFHTIATSYKCHRRHTLSCLVGSYDHRALVNYCFFSGHDLTRSQEHEKFDSA